jgi:hypothetical protein
MRRRAHAERDFLLEQGPGTARFAGLAEHPERHSEDVERFPFARFDCDSGHFEPPPITSGDDTPLMP